MSRGETTVIKKTLVGIALALFATPALAQIQPYAGVDLGYGHVDYQPDGVLPTDAGGQGWAPGLFGGFDYPLSQNLVLSTEFDWAWTNYKGGQHIDTRVTDHEVHYPMNLTIALGWRVRQTTFQFGAGIGRASIETADTNGGTATMVTEGATGMSIVLGFRRDLSARTFLRGEYMKTAYGDVAFISGDEAQLQTTAQVWKVGFGRKF